MAQISSHDSTGKYRITAASVYRYSQRARALMARRCDVQRDGLHVCRRDAVGDEHAVLKSFSAAQAAAVSMHSDEPLKKKNFIHASKARNLLSLVHHRAALAQRAKRGIVCK